VQKKTKAVVSCPARRPELFTTLCSLRSVPQSLPFHSESQDLFNREQIYPTVCLNSRSGLELTLLLRGLTRMFRDRWERMTADQEAGGARNE
jgi:hypothetical protein